MLFYTLLHTHTRFHVLICLVNSAREMGTLDLSGVAIEIVMTRAFVLACVYGGEHVCAHVSDVAIWSKR